MAVEFIRVKSKSTGHEYSLPADAFDKDVHEKVRGAAEEDGVVLPPLLNEKVGSGKKPDPVDTPTGPLAGPSTV